MRWIDGWEDIVGYIVIYVVQDFWHDIQIKCHVENWSTKNIRTQCDLREVSRVCSGISVKERDMVHVVITWLNI